MSVRQAETGTNPPRGESTPGAANRVLVIGGGIAGITAALELARNSIEVYLVEREAAIGGQAALFCCKATETCHKCSVCVLPPKMLAVAAQPAISLLTDTNVTAINGGLGNFSVNLRQQPRFVLVEKCTACGICAELCPTRALRLPFPAAVPHAYTMDQTLCLRFQGEKCTICADNCPTGAIYLAQPDQKIDLTVGAIIVATGGDTFDATEKSLLGYGRFPNVLTGLDLEKRFSTAGKVTLPSNGKEPQKVAFIQCVGSREERLGRGYCSQVCCKSAMRFARLLQNQNPEIKITIFYIDLQTAGKGFGEFYEEFKATIRFVPGLPSEITEVSPDELELKYEDFRQGKVIRERYELAVLSIGMVPRKDAPTLARICGIDLGDYGFFDSSDPLDTVGTRVPGIILAGACHGPKNIAESVAQGTQAASRVMQALVVNRS